MSKTVQISEECHKTAKEFCGERNLKLNATIEEMIISQIKIRKIKEQTQEAM